MIKKNLAELTHQFYEKKKRLVAPLMGFPGVEMTKSNIKLAQQNYGEHFKAIKALVERFNPDMVFPLMDLSVEANAVGRYTVFPREDSATVDTRGGFNFNELGHMREIDVSCDTRVSGYVETMKLMKLWLPSNVVRGAYVTGPFTLAALIIGAKEAVLSILKTPKKMHDICQFTAEVVKEYARHLIDAGAQTICFLEPTAVMLSPRYFQEFSTTYVKQLAENCRNNGVDTIYHICGQTSHLIEKMAESGVGGLSLDSDVTLHEVAEKIPENIAIIGNVSSTDVMTYSQPKDVKIKVRELMDSMKPYPNFIVSTGCDLPQKTPLENIEAFMKTARSYNN
jgi:uroporphyrinogen decarboxylase